MMSDYQWCFENPRDAADLIEQQQQRIAGLERKLQLEEELHHAAESGYTELFATIEEQQKQIDGLEFTIARLRDACAHLEQHNEELSATIYRLRDALQTHTAQPVCCGNVGNKYGPDGEPLGQQCCGWGDFEWPQDVVELLSATPHQNLNAVKRDAFIEGFMFSGQGFNGELYNDGWPKVVELFDTELQIKYPNGEE